MGFQRANLFLSTKIRQNFGINLPTVGRLVKKKFNSRSPPIMNGGVSDLEELRDDCKPCYVYKFSVRFGSFPKHFVINSEEFCKRD